MTENIIVAPSILSGNFAFMAESVQNVKVWGGDCVHCDVMDGVYVNNITFGMPMIKGIRTVTDLPLDVHLMIIEPEKYVERFCDSGADIVTFHPDASKDPLATLNLIKNKGKKCGIVFNPNVPIEPYKELFLHCDMITVMTVFAGHGGQKLIPECIDKVAKVKQILDEFGLDIPIEVDGGIDENNVFDVFKAGARVFVAGSSVFKSKDPAGTIQKFKSVCI